MPSGVRLADPVVLGITTSSTSEITLNPNSSTIDTVSCVKPLDLATAKIAFNESFTSSDDSAKMGCSENIESSSCSSSPIARDSPTDLSRKEGLSSQRVTHPVQDRDDREGSPINRNYFSRSVSDRISPIEGSLAGFRSYSANKDASEFQSMHSALQICSPQHSIQSFHYIPRLSSFPLAPTSSKHPIAMSPSVIVPPPTQKFGKTAETFDISPKVNVRPVEISKSPSLLEHVNTSSITQTEENSSVSATPHGIENILNRPLPRPALVMSPVSQCHQQSCSSNQFQSSFLGLPRSQISLDFSSGVNSIGLHSPNFSGIYWPTLQSFIDNPGLQTLRDRFKRSKTNLSVLLCLLTYLIFLKFNAIWASILTLKLNWH